MNIFVLVAVILLVDFFIFLFVVLPILQRNKLILYLREKGFQYTLSGRRVEKVEGQLRGVSFEVWIKPRLHVEGGMGSPSYLCRLDSSELFPPDFGVDLTLTDPQQLFRVLRQPVSEMFSTFEAAVAARMDSEEAEVFIEWIRAVTDDTTESRQYLFMWLYGAIRVKDGHLEFLWPNLGSAVKAIENNLELNVAYFLRLEEHLEDIGRRLPGWLEQSVPERPDLPVSPLVVAVQPPEMKVEVSPVAGGRSIVLVLQRTETTMGFDLPTDLQWGVTLTGTLPDGNLARVLVPAAFKGRFEDMDPGAELTLQVLPLVAKSSGPDAPQEFRLLG